MLSVLMGMHVGILAAVVVANTWQMVLDHCSGPWRASSSSIFHAHVVPAAALWIVRTFVSDSLQQAVQLLAFGCVLQTDLLLFSPKAVWQNLKLFIAVFDSVVLLLAVIFVATQSPKWLASGYMLTLLICVLALLGTCLQLHILCVLRTSGEIEAAAVRKMKRFCLCGCAALLHLGIINIKIVYELVVFGEVHELDPFVYLVGSVFALFLTHVLWRRRVPAKGRRETKGHERELFQAQHERIIDVEELEQSLEHKMEEQDTQLQLQVLTAKRMLFSVLDHLHDLSAASEELEQQKYVAAAVQEQDPEHKNQEEELLRVQQMHGSVSPQQQQQQRQPIAISNQVHTQQPETIQLQFQFTSHQSQSLQSTSQSQSQPKPKSKPPVHKPKSNAKPKPKPTAT